MYYDLNIPLTTVADLPHTLSFLSSLGYNTVAVSHTILGKLPSQLASPLPESPPAPSNLKVLSRCTLVLSDPSQNHRLAALTGIYDILALRPTSEKLLVQACTNLECDLISLDFSQRLPYPLKHKTVGTALQRGLCFEVCYSAGIDDVAARRNLIQNAAALIRATRGGRGVVISSEAKKVLGLRAPMDVVNLAVLWGLSQEKARDAVCGLARSVVVQAKMRRVSFKGVVEVVDDGIGEEERQRRKRKAEESKGGGGKKAKGKQGGGQPAGGGTQKLSKKERKAQARAANTAGGRAS